MTSFFANSNIWPEEEYQKRKNNLSKITKKFKLELIEGEYRPEDHARAIKGKENNFPERCFDCYRLRLREAANFASKNGYDCFSTTLLISPYQQHEMIIKIGEEISKECCIDFYYHDWRKYFRKSQIIAKDLGIYRQKYCGCKYSAR